MVSACKIRNRTLHCRLTQLMVLAMLMLYSSTIFSQYSFDWDKRYGGEDFEELLSVVEVEDGLVFAGSAGNSAAGDAPPTNGSSDYWFYKTDFEGNIIWSYVYGGLMADVLQNMIRTQDGGFLAVGFSDSNTSGFKSEDSRGGRDVWMVKLDSDGGFMWDATFGGDQFDFPNTVIEAEDGTYYFGGWTESLVSGEVSFPSRGGRFDFWLGHVDQNGNLLYDRRFGSTNDDLLFDITELSNNNLILTGFSNSDQGSEKSENSYGTNDAWMIMMSPDGSIIWDRTYGGTLDDRGSALIEIRPGELIMAGESSSGPSGNKTSTNIGGKDYWLLRLDLNGNIIWDRVYGGTDQDELFEMKSNDKDFLYLGGRSVSNIGGDKSEVNRGFWDYWLVVVDENDVVYYDKTLGGANNDLLQDFALLHEGGVVLAGFTNSDMSGDISDPLFGFNDNWVVSLDCLLDNFLDLGIDEQICPNTETTLDASINQPNVCSYLWDDGSIEAIREVLVATDTDYHVTVTDNFGCLATDTISFGTLEAPIVELGNNFSICEDDIAILDATVMGCPNCTYLWDDMSTNPMRDVSPIFNTTFEVTVTNEINCSTTDQIIVSVMPKSIERINGLTCDEAEARNDTVMSVNRFGCDSLTIYNIILLPTDTVRISTGVCDPDAVGRDTIVGTNIFDCDSITIFTYSLLPSNQINLSDETCDPNQVGLDTAFLINEFDCDSLVITEFSLLPSSEVTLPFLSCDPQDVGRDTFIFTNQFGCDSIIINVTDLILSDTTRLNEPVCLVNEVGTDTLVLTNDVGCDSSVITNYFLITSDTLVKIDFTCDPTEVKNDTTLIDNPNGCDSLIVDILILAPSSEDNELIMTCDTDHVLRDTIFELNIFGCDSIIYREFQILTSDTVRLDDYVCDAPGFVDTSFLLNTNGCDSLVIIEYEEANSDVLDFTDSTCDEEQVGIQEFLFTNEFGCDSLVTIDFELVEAQIVELQQNTCNPAQFLPDTFYYSTPLCDSIVIINYNVQEEDFTTVNLVSCDQGDIGQFTNILTNQFGCDSIVTQIVSFSEQDLNYVSVYECLQADTLIEEFTFTNQFGCDSIVIQTTIPGLDTTFNIATVCELSEEYRNEELFISIEGCDSVVVNQGIFAESTETIFEIFTCDEDQVSSQTFTYDSSSGCDSLVIFNTLLGEINIDADIENIPCGESNTGQIILQGISGLPPYLYSFNAESFSTDNQVDNLPIGIYTVGVQDADGCEAYIEVEITEITGVDIMLPDFIQVDFGDTISLAPIITGDYAEFYWTGIDTLFCELCLEQNYIPLTSTTLTLNVLSTDGCLEKHLVNIAVSKNYNVYIPNAFSPNGDNINDYFMIFGDDNIASISNLNVYTRWGELVFSAENLEPNIELQGWNGQRNGKEMDPGIFVYSAKVVFLDGEIRAFKGDFSLIR